MGKHKGKRFTAEDTGVHHKKLCVTDKFIKLLHRMNMMIENVYLGKIDSGKSKGCRVKIVALESCAILKIGANDGQQELKVCPDPRISVYFLCLTLLSRLQKSDFVSKVELQDEEVCANGLRSIERYDTFSSIFAEFKRRYPRNQDTDICRKLEQYFKVSTKDICNFWYHVHRKEAGIRHDTEWLKGEKKIQDDQGGNGSMPTDKPVPGDNPKREMILVSEAVMEDYQKILETKPPYIQEENAYLVVGVTGIIGANNYIRLKNAGLTTIISDDDVQKLKIAKDKIPQKRRQWAKYVLLKANVTAKEEGSPQRPTPSSQSMDDDSSGTDPVTILELFRELEAKFVKTEERLNSVELAIEQKSITDRSSSAVAGPIPLEAALEDPRQALIDRTPGLKELLDKAARFNKAFPEKK